MYNDNPVGSRFGTKNVGLYVHHIYSMCTKVYIMVAGISSCTSRTAIWPVGNAARPLVDVGNAARLLVYVGIAARSLVDGFGIRHCVPLLPAVLMFSVFVL